MWLLGIKGDGCYVATGDQGRWIGIEGTAAADGVNSTRATVPAGTVHRKAL